MWEDKKRGNIQKEEENGKKEYITESDIPINITLMFSFLSQ